MAHTDITFNGITVRKLHSPDGQKVFGYLTGVLQSNGDLHDLQNHGLNEYSADRRLGAYTIIDKVNGYEVRKLHSRDKREVFGYSLYHNAEGRNQGPYRALGEARDAAGFTKPKSKFTPPKSAYAQNQPGYDPHRR